MVALDFIVSMNIKKLDIIIELILDSMSLIFYIGTYEKELNAQKLSDSNCIKILLPNKTLISICMLQINHSQSQSDFSFLRFRANL